MAPSPIAQRHVNVLASAAARFNDELTILGSSVQALIRNAPPPDPARPALLEMQASIQRSMWLASGMLNYAVRKGARRPMAAEPERLMEDPRF